MYNLIEYSNNCSKVSGSLWQYYRDDLNDSITNSESFKFKIKSLGGDDPEAAGPPPSPKTSEIASTIVGMVIEQVSILL